MADTTIHVVNADNTATPKTTTIVQFNPSSQLPIKLKGSANFLIWILNAYARP